MPSVPDTYALHAIQEGRFVVKVDEGEIWWPTGRRAESVHNTLAYGSILVSSRRPQVRAMAHRVIWIAAYGLIPDGLQVNHRNRRRWDNRIANLELVTPAGNRHHAHTLPYDAIGGNVDVGWLQRLDHGEQHEREERVEELMSAGTSTRTEVLWHRFR